MKATLVIASLFLVVVLVLSWTNPNAVYGETADFSEYEPSDTFFSRLFDSIFGVFIGDSSGFSDEQDEVNRDDIIVFERIHDEPSRDESPPTDDDGDGDGGDEENSEESQSSALSYVELHAEPRQADVSVIEGDIVKTFVDATGEDVHAIVRRPRIDGNVFVFREKGIYEDDYAYILSAIEAAKNYGGPVRLVIPKDEYVLHHPGGEDPYFDLRPSTQEAWGCTDFIFDGNGATFVVDPKHLFLIQSCERIQIKNLHVLYKHRVASRGVVREADGIKYIEIHPDYRNAIGANPEYHHIDALHQYAHREDNFRWKQYATKRWLSSVHTDQFLTYDGTGDRFVANIPALLHTFDVGEELILKHYGYDANAFNVRHGEDIIISDITAHNVPGMFGWVGGVERGIMFHNNAIRNDPKDPLAFVSASHDGFNVGSAGGDIIVTNNWVQHNGDDALNIHSRWYEVVSIEGNRIQFRSEWLNRVRVPVNVGERLAFFDTDFSYKGYGTVIEDVLFDAQTETFTVALDEVPSSLAVFDKVHRVDHASRRFFVSDNTFGQNWARGAMIQASSGIVRTNRIFGNGIGGIVANMDYAYFKSAGPVVNVVIRNNNLLHSGTSLLSSRTLGVASTSMGSISLTTYVLPSDGYYVTFPIHRVVRINDNVVSRAPGIGIQVSSAKDVFVHDNVLEENNLFLPSRFNTGIETGRPADGSIYISDSSDVRLYDNEFIDGSRGVVVGPHVEHCEGCA